MAVARSLSWLSVSLLWTASVRAVPPVTLRLTTAAPTTAADRQGGELCSPTACGAVNISFPFGIIGATETSCGAIGFQFQVLCSNNIPYFGRNQYSPRILDIFYENSSLLVADLHKLEDFNSSACQSPSINSTSKVVFPFSISPASQNMIFYDCAQPPTQAVRSSRGLVDAACGTKTLVGVTKGPDVPGSYYLEGCSATVLPMLARPGEVNPANYMKFIREGFLLTWQLPPSSSPAGN